ncbi:chemotaxis protein CheW [Marinisporobacter balticus]|uniref:Purine-binding chemotaxis protein CheW n=1 Tax=Marinisporobacter balticus TaxID=2018667 RepID=A0A4R2KFF1_9FIRM|nr:chemotaxis protein CheW [Marinisporobacter balticus]TCO69079.1 purine-binding chemotaxis protein CheW [Marinisporobacter balticus]
MSNLQFIVFELEKQQYGVKIDFVNGINKVKDFKISPIPNSTSFIEGMINLRGKIIPLYNLRKRFRFEKDGIAKNDELLIANVNDMMMGLIVDEVIDIVRFEEEDIESTNALFTTNMVNKFISSIAKKDEEMIIILDVEKILTVEEKALITPSAKVGDTKTQNI